MSLKEKLEYIGYHVTKVIEYRGNTIVIARSGLEKMIFIEQDIDNSVLRKLCEIALPLKVKIYTLNEKYQVASIECSNVKPTRDIIRKIRLLDELAEGTTIPHLKSRYKYCGRAYIDLVKLINWLKSRKLLEQSGQTVKTKRPLTLDEKVEILLKIL